MLLPPLDPAREAQRVPRPRAPSLYGGLDLGWALALGSDVRVFAIVGHRGVRPHMGFSASRVMVPSWGHEAPVGCARGPASPPGVSDDDALSAHGDPLLAPEPSRPPRGAGVSPSKEAAPWTTLRLVPSKGGRVRSRSIGRETSRSSQNCCFLIAHASCRLSLRHAPLPTQAQPASHACSKKHHSPSARPGVGSGSKLAELQERPSTVDDAFNMLPRKHVASGA